MDKKVSKKRAEKVSGVYANGRYDCNLSYWDNLNNLLEEIPEEQAKQECISQYVNSRMRNGKLEVVFRELVEEGQNYEHCN